MAQNQSADEVNIKVAIRIRPTNQREKGRNAKQILTCDQEKKQVNLSYGTGKKAVSKSYQFDKVFGQYSTQSEVFTSMVAPIIDEVMEGYNCTVFAYGQTGTGKTHTMEGQFDDAEQRGIIPRSVHLIFQQLEDKKVDFSVKASYLEIYNEELGDLLDDSYGESSSDKRKSVASSSSSSSKHKKLLLCDGEKGVVCNNLTEVNCYSAKEVFESLRKGINARQVAETQMNKASSRSHSIVTLKIMMKEHTVNGEVVRFGQLNLVDLAGSECVQRSGATGERLREAGNINQSLLTLGRVITGLSDRKSGFIPYRDSKLTRLLQESLGGRAKTCILATVSPADDSVDESGSTLEYAQRARSIKNKPVTNSTSSKNNVLRESSQEVEEMRRILQAQRDKSGTYLPTEKYEEMIVTIETGKANLDMCEEEIKRLREQLSTEKLRGDGLSADLMFSKKQCADTEAELDTTKQVLHKTETDLTETRGVLQGTQAIVSEQSATEVALTNQATLLDHSLAESTSDITGLLEKVQRAFCDANIKSSATCKLGEETLVGSSILRQRCCDLTTAISKNSVNIKAILTSASERNSHIFDSVADDSAKYDCKLSEMSDIHFTDSSKHLVSMQTEVTSYGASMNSTLNNISANTSSTDGCVSSSVTTALELIQQQNATLESLSREVEEAAVKSEGKMSEFVRVNAFSLQQAQDLHKEETQKQECMMEEMKQSIAGFSSAQQQGMQKRGEDATARRQETAQLYEKELQAEVEAATTRAEELEKEAQLRNEALEKEADELLSNFASAINEFKSRHMDSATTAAASTSSTVTSGARDHVSRMSAMFTQVSQQSKAADEAVSLELTGSMSEFESTSVTSVQALSAMNQSSSEKLHEAIQESVSQVQCLADSTGQVSSETVANTKQSIDQARSLGNDVSSECSAMHDNVKVASSELGDMVSELSTLSGTIESSMTSSCEHVLQVNKDQTSKMAALAEERQASLRESLNQGIAALDNTHESVVAANGSLQEMCLGHVTAHDVALSTVESNLTSHVALVSEALPTTGATPVKRKFEKPDEFTSTRAHAMIMKESLKSNKKSKHCVEVREMSENEAPTSSKANKGDSTGEAVKNPLMEATNTL